MSENLFLISFVILTIMGLLAVGGIQSFLGAIVGCVVCLILKSIIDMRD